MSEERNQIILDSLRHPPVWLNIIMFFVLAFIMNTVRDQLHPIAVTIPDDAQAQQTSTTTATQQQVSQQASQTFILRVVGGKDLERRLWKALELIWAADRPLFNEFKQFIFVVRLGDRTAFQMENGIPTISVTRAAASRSATWCSGEIIHQYFHARQYYLAQKSTAQELSALGQPQQLRMPEGTYIPVDPADAASVENLEKQADAFQIDLLKKINAPQSEIDAVANRPARDYSITHDGI